MPRKDIKVLGVADWNDYAGANSMFSGHYISELKLISQKLGYVMCGGDLSAFPIVQTIFARPGT